MMLRKERSKSLRSEDSEVLLSRSEEERLRRERREWMIQREKERKHEELKRQKILEFEIEYARKRGLPLPERCTQHSHSKSKSRSPDNQHGRKDSSSKPKTSILSEKLDGTDGNTPLFKGPEGTQIRASELRKIKVDIHRNISKETTAATELQREIINPEDVLVKRREGEGSKPIFEREELKCAASKSDEVEEHRTVVVVNNEKLGSESRASKKYTVSSRSRSRSPRRMSSRLSRYEDRESDRNDRKERRSRDKRYGRSRERSRGRYSHSRRSEEKKLDRDSHRRYEDRESNRNDRKERRSRDKRYGRSRERSRGRYSHSRRSEEKKLDRDSHSRSLSDERSHREYRERSRERSRDRTDRSREHGISHYVEQIPVPIYYGHELFQNFPPGPMMVGPSVPFRGPLIDRRHAPMMGPMRPLPPRFMPPNMFRLPPPTFSMYSCV